MIEIFSTKSSINDLYSVNYLQKFLNKLNLRIPQGNIPEEEFLSTIELIHDKSNPIIFMLKNGNKLFFTYPEYRRLHGRPEIGKTIKYSFQKIPLIQQNIQPYIIKSCIIF